MVLDGKEVSNFITKQLKEEVSNLKKKGRNLELIVFTSNDKASEVYVKNKVKKGEELGINVRPIFANSYGTVCSVIHDTTSPFIIQEPSLISKENINQILNLFSHRDVDGFGSDNLGKLFKGLEYISPCTPKGIISLFKFYKIPLISRKITVIGRSNIVGRPLAALLEHEDAIVTLCHSKTFKNQLHNICDDSDIIISATGQKDVLNGWKAKSNQILIDVGMNRNKDGKLCGDFSKETVESCYAYTPVPGGVGPMTVISLMENVVDYYKKYVLN